MKLEHSFTIPLPVDEAWVTLLDIQRVALAFPGASLDRVDESGDSFTGTVKVKLGPIAMTYGGAATFTSRDETTHTATLDASGRDSRGAGTARARVVATLSDAAEGRTKVSIETDLAITGKPAQFGRGVIVEVSDKILAQFARNLEANLQGGTPSPDGASQASLGSTAPADEALDLGPAVLIPMLKRFAPMMAAVVVAIGTVVTLRKRGH